MKTLNLTQHAATPDQIAAGVVDLPPLAQADLRDAMTFDEIPTSGDVAAAADIMGLIAYRYSNAGDQVMIGGAPYLMAPLEQWLVNNDRVPVYAFSIRESVEKTLPDGSVQKINVFRHAGFVTGCLYAP